MSSRIIYIDGKRIIDRVRSGVWLFNYSEPPVAEEAFFDRLKISLHGRIEYPSWHLFEDYIGHIYNRGRGQSGRARTPFRTSAFSQKETFAFLPSNVGH